MIRLPQRIATQLMLLLLGSTIVFQASVMIIQSKHPARVESLPFQAQPLVIVVQALSHLPEMQRAPFLVEVNRSIPESVIRIPPATVREATGEPDPLLARQLLAHLPAGTKLAMTGKGFLQIRVPDALVVEVEPTYFKPPAPNFGFVAVTLIVMIGCGACFIGYAYFYLRRPLNAFARAVERFGRDQSFEPVPERGPVEIAGVARVLNHMQARIATLINDRTRTLAALGHDLRTPITRMRLHAEKVADTPLRTAMVSDLDYMQRMTHAALTFLRGGALAAQAPIDVASLLQTICDEADEMGQPVAYTGPDHLIVDASIDELRRAVTNLVVNAVFQQANVVVALRDRDPATIDIEVIDDGPGISDAEKAKAFEPFWRGERNRYDRTGLGLGLSIVHNVARSHNGEVSLHDREGGGLICRLRLPRGIAADAVGLAAPDTSPVFSL